MENVKDQALALYKQHGFKGANFIAFDRMQHADDHLMADYWLRVINQISVLDILMDQSVLQNATEPC